MVKWLESMICNPAPSPALIYPCENCFGIWCRGKEPSTQFFIGQMARKLLHNRNTVEKGIKLTKQILN